jgi:maltooligosyltrehalose trehalohydrolase
MSPAQALKLGAHLETGGVRFSCFTDAEHCRVQIVDEGGAVRLECPLEAMGDGYFQGVVPGIGEGALYYFLVGDRRLPDPYARYLPQGVHGPARVEPPGAGSRGPRRELSELVIYELHVGTFTEAGTFEGAIERLPEVAALGVTAIELMPVAAFAGERGWGYDGVALYAPHAPYGTPDELRRLVAEAHRLGLNVLLDVVYNHFGPSGNYLPAFSSRYFSEETHNDWGQGPNYTHPALRRLIVDNVRYWLEEFGFDGLRLDATHAIIDPSPTHVLEDVARLARSLDPPRWVIAEDDRNLAALVTETGLSAVWADDFHHQVRATLTGERAAYFAAFEPSLEGIAEAINKGWIYQGQYHPIRRKPRGTPANELSAEALVFCIQNHDQIGNRALGDRFPAGPLFRAASLLLLYLPMTPLLFMGQEWGATTPFMYFTDHDEELGRLICEGRRREFAGFPEYSDPEKQADIPNPQLRETFVASKLRWSERDVPQHAETLALYRAALELRRTDPVWRESSRDQLSAEVVEGVLVVRRWRENQWRVLLLNAGREPKNLEDLARKLDLGRYGVQLSSGKSSPQTLEPETAVVLTG